MTNQKSTARRRPRSLTSTGADEAAHRQHRGGRVNLGGYFILLGGTLYLQPEDLRRADVLIPLTEVPLEFGKRYRIGSEDGGSVSGLPPLEPGRNYELLAAPLKDFGGVPECWEEFLRRQVIPLLGRCWVMAFCAGSHGRTGTLLASLIAILEPETADPIKAARQRHCARAVETLAQAQAVFGLRGKKLPERYRRQFQF